MCQNNKIHIEVFVEKLLWYNYMDKIRRANVSILYMYSNIYNLYMCKHETIRKQWISYLTFISVIGNLETTYQLTGYSVKVYSDIPYSSIKTWLSTCAATTRHNSFCILHMCITACARKIDDVLGVLVYIWDVCIIICTNTLNLVCMYLGMYKNCKPRIML